MQSNRNGDLLKMQNKKKKKKKNSNKKKKKKKKKKNNNKKKQQKNNNKTIQTRFECVYSGVIMDNCSIPHVCSCAY